MKGWYFLWQTISIHAARVGCDVKVMAVNAGGHDFNPRSPSGLRHGTRYGNVSITVFQSTQPEWAATALFLLPTLQRGISIHAARVGCDRIKDGDGAMNL